MCGKPGPSQSLGGSAFIAGRGKRSMTDWPVAARTKRSCAPTARPKTFPSVVIDQIGDLPLAPSHSRTLRSVAPVMIRLPSDVQATASGTPPWTPSLLRTRLPSAAETTAILSAPPVLTSRIPSGSKARAVTCPLCGFHLLTSFVVPRFQTLTDPSLSPAATRLPSRLTATDMTCPFPTSYSFTMDCELVFQRRRLPSLQP